LLPPPPPHTQSDPTLSRHTSLPTSLSLLPSDTSSFAGPKTLPKRYPPHGGAGTSLESCSHDCIPSHDQPQSATAPWRMNPEHRFNRSISDGYNHAISPSHSNGGHLQPTPPPDQQSQALYMSDYGTVVQRIPRKHVRATQACNHCRSRKQKCDEARPCQFCRENNFDCQYKDLPPPKYVAFTKFWISQ
jgi:hypothetical protein